MARREASTDPRAVRTRRALVDATVELLADHPARELSVTAIVRRAGVSRQVFYEHFADRGSVLFAAAESILGPIYADFVREFEPRRGYAEQVAGLIRSMNERGAEVRSLMDSSTQGKATSYLLGLLTDAIRPDLQAHLEAAGVEAGEEAVADTARFLAAGTQALLVCGFAEGAEPEEVGRRMEEVRRTLAAFSVGASESKKPK